MDYKKLDQLKTPKEWMESVLAPKNGQDAAIRISERRKKRRRMRIAAAVLICVLVCGTGITAAAASSDTFRTFLAGIFGQQNVSEVRLADTDVLKDAKAAGRAEDESAAGEASAPDIRADSDGLLSLREDDTVLAGENESFISVFHWEGESEERVDRVYTVEGDGLQEMPVRQIEGTFEGKPFSFGYVTKNGEIYGFNQQGEVCEVFHHMDGDTVYVTFWEVKDDTVQRECIAALNLATGKTERLSDDNMICNFKMSPGGQVILCNHRADGYWSVFDIAERTERKVPAINGYARTDEIEYLDDYHVLTPGEPVVEGDTEIIGTIRVNLLTGETEQAYDGCGEISMQWSYEVEGRTLILYGITDGSSFSIEDVNKYTHPLVAQGEYVLFGALEEPDAAFYLVNMEKQTWMELDLPEEMRQDGVDIHLVRDQKKMLLMNCEAAKAYLVDIRSM